MAAAAPATRPARVPQKRLRASVYLSPHALNRLELLRRNGVVDGAPPRAVNVVIVDAICLAAAWAETHPGETPDLMIREWRRRVPTPRTPNR